MSTSNYSLAELSEHLGAKLKGDANCQISGIAPLEKAQHGQISFLYSPKFKKFLSTTAASAVVVSPNDIQDGDTNLLVMDNPYLGYAKVAALFLPKPATKMGIHPSAVVGEGCHISPTACIGAKCVIGDNVTIGDHTILSPGTVIGNDSSIGDSCLIWSNVTIYHNCHMGSRVIIQSGAVIGSDGFGMANDKGRWHKIPQLGGVIIGNDVEVGANTTIDRGALENTVIEDGVKLDNLIQIAHNVQIGAHTIIAACVAIAGSTRIGKYCMIGGAASINGHIEITDGVIITATSGVNSSLTKSGMYSAGLPLQPSTEWRKNAVRFKQLDEMAKRLRKLEAGTQ